MLLPTEFSILTIRSLTGPVAVKSSVWLSSKGDPINVDTRVNITGIEFINPIILASGPLSTSRAAWFRAENNGFGGVVTKSATIAPSEGNPQPRWAFGKGYLVMSDGLPNPGYLVMANNIKEAKESGIAIPIIASVAGASPEEFAEMSREFERKGADGIELNLGCPHRGGMVGKTTEEHLGRYWSETPERSFRVVRAVKDAVKIPVWAKFPFEIVYQNPEAVLKMEAAGVDGVSPYAAVPMGMAINLETGKPVLGNPKGTGTVAGQAMKPLGIKCVAELSKLLKTPVIASGGVFSGHDAIEYIMAGTQGVQLLTAIMQKISVPDMTAEIEKFMLDHGYENLQAFRGKALDFLP